MDSHLLMLALNRIIEVKLMHPPRPWSLMILSSRLELITPYAMLLPVNVN
jgi:hypothetical protein